MKKAGNTVLILAALTAAAAAVTLAPPRAEAAMTRASAESLMRSGKSIKCSVTVPGGGDGSVYISGGKMRGDFDVIQPGEEEKFVAHMIQDGEWAYTWGGPLGETQGTRMRVDRSAGPGSPGAFDTDEEMDMDCREWQPDASRFTVPSGIQFVDVTGMAAGIPGMSGMSGGMPADIAQMQCQACDQAPEGPERDMCRQMMGCA